MVSVRKPDDGRTIPNQTIFHIQQNADRRQVSKGVAKAVHEESDGLNCLNRGVELN